MYGSEEMREGTTTIRWRPADPALAPFVRGYVHRTDAVVLGTSVQLPFAIPVIHIDLRDDARAVVALSGGSRIARAIDPNGPIDTFVVALGFAGAARFAPVAALATVDTFVPLDGPRWRDLRSELRDSPDFAARAVVADRRLRAWIDAPPPSRVVAAADAIAADRWRGSVARLAQECGLEERTLRNQFTRQVGWSPKHLLRVARFNRALRTLHPRPWPGRAAADARLEFFDDAHFHRDFRAHAGIGPAAFVALKRGSGDALLHTLGQ